MKKILFTLPLFLLFYSCSDKSPLSSDEIKKLIPNAKKEKQGDIILYYSPDERKSVLIKGNAVSFQGDFAFISKGLKYFAKNEKAVAPPSTVITFKRNGKNWACQVKTTNNIKSPYVLNCVQEDSFTCDFYRQRGYDCVEF